MESHCRREQRKLSTQDVNDQVADTRWPMTDLRGPSTAQFRACSFRTSVIGYSASGYRRPAFTFLPAKNEREYKRCDDAGVTLDNELRRIDSEFPPSDLLVRNGSGVRSVTRCRVGDLTEGSPHRDILAL